jgi:transcriptional regulator of NAD metabolism
MLALKRSYLNKESILINVLKTSSSVISVCSLVEDYTELFYVIVEGDISSIQCKMSLMGP